MFRTTKQLSLGCISIQPAHIQLNILQNLFCCNYSCNFFLKYIFTSFAHLCKTQFKLYQIGWRSPVNTNFHILPQILNSIYFWALSWHSITLIRFDLNHSIVDLTADLWSLICWLVSLRPSSNSFAYRDGFSSRIAFHSSIFPSTLLSLLTHAEETHPNSKIVSASSFQVGIVRSVQCQVSTTSSVRIQTKRYSFSLFRRNHLLAHVWDFSYVTCNIRQTRLLMVCFQHCLTSCHASIKDRFVECTTNSLLVDTFFHMNC